MQSRTWSVALRSLLLASVMVGFAFGQVTTYHYNNARTGATLNETILNTSNVNVSTFGKLFSLPVDGQIYAQPLYVPNLSIPQQGIHNVVFLVTQHNSVYAFDADSASQTAPLWHVNLGPSMPSLACCMGQDILPEIGITSTPVIDLTSGTIYVVAESLENRVTYFRLHALDITTGVDKVPPAVIQGSVPGTSFDSVQGVLAFDPIQHWQRPGLLLMNGNIYLGFASHQDNTPYHGWLFGYTAATLQQSGILCFSPNGEENGVWQGGVGLSGDANGNIYLETGNGPFDVSSGGHDYGDSIVKIGTTNGLTILDYFTPSTQLSDQNNDWDLGSSGPLLIPGTQLGVAGGKDGKLYVFDTTNLGKFNSMTDQLVQEWQATFSYSAFQSGGFWGGNYIFYNSTLYGYGERDVLNAFSFNGSQFNTTPTSQGAFQVPSAVSNDPAMGISANGTVPGTGIVWAAFSTTARADGNPFPGIFHAFDASNVAHELWNSNQNSTRDYSGDWAKWAPPTIANGKVYLATFDNLVNVYGVLPGGETITAAVGSPQSAAVNTAFGTALQAVVKDSNSNPLSGVTVTFTVPSTGPSAAFSGSATATAVTNASGIATAPALTANGQAGSYSVTASATGVNSPASFSLTNLSGAPATIAATVGTPQSATVNTVFGTALQAVVKDANSNVLSGVTVTFSAPNTGASATFGGLASTTAITNSSGIATAPALTADAQAGGYTVTASAAAVTSLASFNLTNTAATTGGGGTGSLSGSGNSATTAFNLTAEGATDWVHWGDSVLNRKTGVTPQIGNYTTVGSGQPISYTNDPRTLSWTDGAPTATGSNNDGLYLNSVPNGYSFTVPADGSTRNLTVHVGGWLSGGTFTAHLSDRSAADYVDTTSPVNGQYDRNYTLAYNAGSAGQTLMISWVASSGGGNVTLNGAAFSLAGPSVTAAVGTPQSAAVNTVFGTALQALVKDAGNNPLNGVTVTFTAPSTGASATFGGLASTTAVTNASGIATAPALTANGQLGSYTVTASAAGASTPANFSLTNTAAVPASITATAGTGQGATVNAVFGTALQATVKDASSNPLSGVTVTFSAPSTGASAMFGGLASTTALTNASGIATASALTANGQTGTYSVTASVTGVTTPASFSLTNTAAATSGGGGSGSLTGAGNSATTAFNLTVEGTTDWVHWGDPGVNRKTGVTPQIGNYSVVGTGQPLSYSNDLRTLSWTDGAPTATASNKDGLYINYTLNGFSFTVPADGNTRNLTVHVGGWLSGGTLTAHLSDKSAPDYVDSTTPGNGQYDRNYTLTYSAAAAGQTLNVSWVATSGAGNVTLNGVALSLAGPSVAATVGTPQSATVNTAFGTALQATVKDSSSNPLSGVSVTFTAPGTGASATFAGLASATAVTNSSGVATAPALTANGQTGNYTVTASATGVAASANFSLTNTAAVPASITATSGNSQGATVNKAFGTALQATVKDSGNNPLSGITVTFAAPAAGPSGVFSGSATAITNASGIATAPALTANNQAGSYSVTATVAGVTTPASFSLTNTAAVPASIAATVGTPQSAAVNTAFGTALQAAVKDASNNALSGVTVTFVAPSTGASATFAGLTSTTAVTNGSGIATAPALTANNQAGSYSVTASVAGVTTPTGFSLTNTAAVPASIAATVGTPQSATVNTAFGTALQAVVKDASSNALSGVTVTFSAPSTGSSATFAGLTSTTAITNSSGIATAPAPTANSQTGSYSVTASVAGVTTPASFSLTNTAAATGGGGSGSLTGSGNSATTTFNLTVEGTTDWVHWGDSVLNRKTGVTPQIGNYAIVGAGPTMTYTNDLRTLSWTDGAPTAAGSNNDGLYINSLQNGFSFTAPADTNTRNLTVHVGGWLSGGTLTAHLSDGSAPDFVDSTTPVNGQYDRNYSLAYNAASAGQTLKISWVATSGAGNVTLNGAAVSLAGPSITATIGTPQSATVSTAFGTALQAVVKDASNNPLNGVTVTFSAPSTGASAAFGGLASTTAVTNGSGVAIAPTLTANNQAGNYTVTASTAGAATSAGFSLTNLSGAPASIAATAGTSQIATVNSAFGTALQATVKDAGSNPLPGVTVTFTAPATGSSGTFGSLASTTAITNASGVATAPSFTANSTIGSYSVMASVAGVTTPASFSLANSAAVISPVKLVQSANINSMINLPSETVAFTSANKAGNWIGVVIFAGQSSTHTFTVTDTNGNTYIRALTVGNTAESTTLGIYYAENIKAGANQVKIVPDKAGYLRIAILEYSGLATSSSLDVTAAAQGTGAAANSGSATTTAAGDLLLGGAATSDANVTAGPGYALEVLIPTPPGTRLTTEDQVQTNAGPASASVTLGASGDWAMGLAAFKKAH